MTNLLAEGVRWASRHGQGILRLSANFDNFIFAKIKKGDTVNSIAKKYKGASDALFLGRGYNFPVALEGALKLKEISYIHAEGYPAAEMKHGPIALVDDKLTVVFVATKDAYHAKIVSNIQEIKARKSEINSTATPLA